MLLPEASDKGKSVVMLTIDRRIDRRILQEADSLSTSGWTVTVIAMPRDDGRKDDDPRIVRIGSNGNSVPRNDYRVLQIYKWVRRSLPMNGPWMRTLKALAWRYLVDQESFFVRLFGATAFRYSPAVFTAHDLPMLPVASMAAGRRCARLVYDSHELYCETDFSRLEKKRWTEIEAKYIQTCHAVITVNRSIAAELECRYGIPEVNVILNAEHSAKLPRVTKIFHELYSLSAGKKVLLFQGGLSAGRNLEGLAESMRFVRNSSVVLVILGDGVVERKLNAVIEKNNLFSRIYVHSAVPQKDLCRFTSAADAGVIPYQETCLNNLYCTPNKLFEFISAGLPILANDLPELRRMVEGQKIGQVGKMTTPRQIAALIDDFFSDEKRFCSWKINLEEVGRAICWENEARKLVKIYEEIWKN